VDERKERELVVKVRIVGEKVKVESLTLYTVVGRHEE